ncbi:hypothetical protein Vi05172_g5663 [Venturia inaequalis]|nr:hypothetical protein Vi05172_g5663 [Venturia inaequalis]
MELDSPRLLRLITQYRIFLRTGQLDKILRTIFLLYNS